MKRIFILLAASVAAGMACAEIKAQDWANFGAYSQANAEVVSKPAAVFMGDSITEGWGRQDGSFLQTMASCAGEYQDRQPRICLSASEGMCWTCLQNT